MCNHSTSFLCDTTYHIVVFYDIILCYDSFYVNTVGGETPSGQADQPNHPQEFWNYSYNFLWSGNEDLLFIDDAGTTREEQREGRMFFCGSNGMHM